MTNSHSNCNKCGVEIKNDHHLRQYCTACVYTNKYGLSQIMYNTLDYLYQSLHDTNLYQMSSTNYRVKQLKEWGIVSVISGKLVYLNDNGVKFWEAWCIE